MKFGYQFSNLCGTVYNDGNLIFTPDGNSVVSPVGNRVSVFDLVGNKSKTLPCENNKNIHRCCLSPDGSVMITVDIDGRALLINFLQGVILNHFNFHSKVSCIKFSPDGRFFAVSTGKLLQVWRSPSLNKEFAPFVLHRKYAGHYDDIVCLDWSPDGKFIITGSKDMTARIYSLHPIPGYKPLVLTGHRNYIQGVFFSQDMENIYTVSKDGALFVWFSVNKYSNINPKKEKVSSKKKKDETDPESKRRKEEEEKEEEEEEESEDEPESESEIEELGTKYKWHLKEKHFFNKNHARVTCVEFHKPLNLLVVGFTSGIFGIFEVPEFNEIHSLSISQRRITTVSINPSGDWLVFGCARMGQLLVWEWKSETYILKQQGHFYDMNVLDYSPDGQLIVTGGDDSKVKIWNTRTGFCFVTFKEHSGGITGVQFSPKGKAVFSSSLDGTVRAFDLTRYRNFRTFTSPSPVQFSCLAIDQTGDIVCAGSIDTFQIFVWSVQTSRLLEMLSGHEGPVTSLAFSPASPVLYSGSWDHSIRVWDVFENKATPEVLVHKSDVRAVAIRPDGGQMCVATLDGDLTFWDLGDNRQTGSLSCRRDLGSGRKVGDLISAKNNVSGKCFTSICYSADGRCIVAGGKSKFVCIYEIEQQVLLRKFKVSNNQSLDGLNEKLNSKNIKDGHSVETVDDDDESDDENRKNLYLPGVKAGDLSARNTRPEMRIKNIKFSPTGRAWSACTTEGLSIFSLDDRVNFDPFDLDMNVTPTRILQLLQSKEYIKAISMSFRLNESILIKRVVESISVDDIALVVQGLHEVYVPKLLNYVSSALETTKHVEFHLTWCFHLFNCFGQYFKDNAGTHMPIFRVLQKNISHYQDALTKLCDENKYTMAYLKSISEIETQDTEEN